LEQFVTSDELDAKERARLETLPRERMFHELRKLYFLKHIQRGRSSGRRRDGGRFGRDGDKQGPGPPPFERGRGSRGGKPPEDRNRNEEMRKSGRNPQQPRGPDSASGSGQR
jgi:hypothetical protein